MPSTPAEIDLRSARVAARRRDLLAALREARTLALELFRIEGQPYAAALVLLCDAQTSGGLLIAVPPERAERLITELTAELTPIAVAVGAVETGSAGAIRVVA